MKKSTPYDPPGPGAGEVSASHGFDDIPPAEIVTDFEEDGEERGRSDRAYFTVVDEETAPRTRGAKPRVAGSSSPLPRGREGGTSFTPRPDGPDRGTHDSMASAAPYHLIGSGPSPEEMPFGLPPLPVLVVAIVLLLLAL